MLFEHGMKTHSETNEKSVGIHPHEQTNDETHGTTGEYVSIRQKNGEPSWKSGRGSSTPALPFKWEPRYATELLHPVRGKLVVDAAVTPLL